MTSMDRFPRPLDDLAELLESLSFAAVEKARNMKLHGKKVAKRRAGEVRHPGQDTPLWNALVAAVRPHLVQRGAKSNLARILGVPRQRIHEYITRPTALPDAETVLHLALWLANQENQLAKGRHARPVA